MSLRSWTISRVREGLDGVFFDNAREGVEKFGREGRSLGACDWEGAGVAGVSCEPAGGARGCVVAVGLCGWPGCHDVVTGVLISGGSEDGGSEPMPGFNGVRNGDLNGLCSVLAASFSRRRLACGVDIFACRGSLGGFVSICVMRKLVATVAEGDDAISS